MKMGSQAFLQLSFDIDRYLDPLLPPSQIYRLPTPISRFLGRRDSSRPKIGNVVALIWSFIGAFCGIALIAGVFRASTAIHNTGAPIIIGSFGAAAILEYNAIESPFAQPRNLVLGHFLSALVGVSITKLFALLPHNRFEDLRWLAGSLAVGVSSVVMGVTKTVHPPAGAVALLAATSHEITRLGWDLLGLVLLGSILMLGSACLINNIFRQFPIYWWTPAELGVKSPRSSDSSIEDISQAEKGQKEQQETRVKRFDRAMNILGGAEFHQDVPVICITTKKITVPDSLELDDWERNVLEILRERLSGAAESNTRWDNHGHRLSDTTACSKDTGDEQLPV